MLDRFAAEADRLEAEARSIRGRDLQASAECRSRLIAALLMTMAAILERKDNDR